ncbi:MAG: energy transducer TonB, partial [Bacteroidota bacterium]
AFRPNVERPAYFQGGKTALVDYVSNHVIYPELALENAHEGIVIVEFTVQKNGSIKNAKIVKSLGFGCDEVALVLVKNMPKWQAAQQGERAVKSRVRLPLAFYL